MKTQIVLIGGGHVSKTRKEYLNYLRTREVSFDLFRFDANWKNHLQHMLGDNYDILIPQMPNNQNARYLEWRLWFGRIAKLLSDNVILIGHSLGGIFLAKYLAANTFPRKITATFFLAAPFVFRGEHWLADFYLGRNLGRVVNQGGKLFVYHSTDDTIVPVVCAERYKKALPEATVRIFENYGHLNQREFPEILRDILALQKS